MVRVLPALVRRLVHLRYLDEPLMLVNPTDLDEIIGPVVNPDDALEVLEGLLKLEVEEPKPTPVEVKTYEEREFIFPPEEVLRTMKCCVPDCEDCRG